MSIWVAALAAVAVQPLVFLARLAPEYLASSQPVYGLGFVLLAVIVVAAAIVLIVGIPAFLLLHKMRRDSWTSLAFAGLVLGALPAAISWPRELEGFSAGQNWHGKYVETYIQGSPTLHAWLLYGESVLSFALHGLAGALVFYAVWRWRQRPNKSLQPTAFGGG